MTSTPPSQTLYCLGKIMSRPAGMGKKKDRRKAPEIFEGNFAYNWSLCEGKIQQFLNWTGKLCPKTLKRPERSSRQKSPGCCNIKKKPILDLKTHVPSTNKILLSNKGVVVASFKTPGGGGQAPNFFLGGPAESRHKSHFSSINFSSLVRRSANYRKVTV